MGIFREIARDCHVGDHRNGKYGKFHVTGRQHFGYGRHADGIGTDQTVMRILCRGFKARTGITQVHAFTQVYSDAGCNLMCKADQLPVVRLAHIGEPGSQFIDIFTPQGAFGEKVDVIADNHQFAYGKIRIDAAGGVGEEGLPDSQQFHDPQGEYRFDQ